MPPNYLASAVLYLVLGGGGLTVETPRVLFERHKDIVLLIEPDGRILDANQAALEAYGYTRDELLSLNVLDLRAGDTLALVRSQMDIADREGIVFETVHRRKDGSLFPVQVSSQGATLAGKRVLVSIVHDISERESARQAIQAERDFSTAVLDTVGALVVVLDREGRIVRFNRACEQATGYRFEEVQGKRVWDLFLLPEEAESVKAVFRELAAGHFPNTHENYWVARDGTRRLISWSNTALVNDQGVVQYVIGSGLDITERRLAETRLQQTTSELQAIFKALPDLYFRIHADGTILGYEAGQRSDLYAPPEDFMGRRMQDVLPQPVAGQFADAIEEVMRTRSLVTIEYAMTLPKGEQAFEARLLPLNERQIVSVVRNITQRRQAEQERERLLAQVEQETRRVAELAQAAQQHAAELQGVLDNMIDGVFVCDLSGAITLTNRASVQLLGLHSASELQRSLNDLREMLNIRHVDGRPVQLEELPLQRALAGQVTILEDEVIFNRLTGRDVFLRTNAAPIRDASGRIVGAVEVARDVTELMELEQFKDQFISAAAHELKTPVTTVKGYAQMMRRWMREGQEPRVTQAVEVINSQCDRINRRVEEMLEVVRLRTAPPELHRLRFDLDELASEVVQRLQSTTQAHRILLERDSPVPVVADREHIEEALVTLLENAIKFSPEGGDIEVRVRARGREAIVSVKDRGVGIPQERQPHVLEPFYEPVPPGAPGYQGVVALSLYISRLNIERHRGRIWFESKPGQGSTFYFSLPLAKPGGNGRRAE